MLKNGLFQLILPEAICCDSPIPSSSIFNPLFLNYHVESFLLRLPFIGIHQRFILVGTLRWHFLLLLFNLVQLQLGGNDGVHRRPILAIFHFGIFVHILGQQFGAFQLATVLTFLFRFSAASFL